MKISILEKAEKKIFSYHMIYSIVEGVIFGVFVLNEFVFIKSMKGTEFQLALLIQFGMTVFIFSVLIHVLLRRFKKKNILRFASILTRLPLFAIAFFPTEVLPAEEMAFYHYFFLSIFLFYYLAYPIVFPIINDVLKNNYKNEHFGSLYSYATTVNKIIMMLSTFFFGWLLDFDNFSFVYVYPIMGGLGIISLHLFSLAVKVEYMDPEAKKASFKESMGSSIEKIRGILKFNKPYRDFELGFMLYGFAFIFTMAIISLFLANELNLNYTSLAFYKNSYNLIAIILLPFFGKLINRIDPRKFAVYTFFSLLMYIFFMGLTEYFPYYFDVGNYRFYYLLLISFAWNGIFAATMTLLWNIGSSYFCKDEDAGSYQSIHLSMVGLRAMIAPLFGIWAYQYVGYSGVFAIGIFFLALSIMLMFYSMKRNRVEA